jgi:hypothetical protein
MEYALPFFLDMKELRKDPICLSESYNETLKKTLLIRIV